VFELPHIRVLKEDAHPESLDCHFGEILVALQEEHLAILGVKAVAAAGGHVLRQNHFLAWVLHDVPSLDGFKEDGGQVLH